MKWDIMALREPICLLRKLYFWKGMKPQIYQYVKQCKTCQQYNITPVRYAAGHFEVPKALWNSYLWTWWENLVNQKEEMFMH